MKTSDTRKHLVFSGAAGIGKTKLLDHMVDISEDQNMKYVIIMSTAFILRKNVKVDQLYVHCLSSINELS